MGHKEEDAISLLAEVTTHTVIVALMVILSLTGNSLVCLAFYRNRRLRTITNFYVLSLAGADIMMATFVFAFVAVASGLRKWSFDYNFCQFSGFISVYWVQVSLCILALTSINRYFCVVKPQRYSVFFTKKKTIFSIVSVSVFLFIINLTSTLAIPISYRWHPNSLYCRETFLDQISLTGAYIFIGCFIGIPMFLVVFGYGSVYRIIRQHNTAIVPSLQEANGHGTISAQDIKTSRLLFATVFVFFVCWTPFPVMLILEFAFKSSISSSKQSIYPLFSSTSSWINPVICIYGVMNRAMRKEFRDILFCRKQ